MDCHAHHGIWDPDLWIIMDFMDAGHRVMHYDGFHRLSNLDSQDFVDSHIQIR